MKKVIFGILFLFTLLFAVQVFDILVNDYSRLTEFGYGYLAGKGIIFFLLLSGSFFLGKRIYRDSGKKN